METTALLTGMLFTTFCLGSSKNITTLKDLPYIDQAGPKIIAGHRAAVGQFPWQAAIHITNADDQTYLCGGALISHNWILTAAHCADGGKFFVVQLGGVTLEAKEEGRVKAITDKAIVHPDYDAESLANDIALIKLREPVEYNARIRAVDLAPRGSYIKASEFLTVSGYGKTSDGGTPSKRLNYVQLKTIANEECRMVYGSATITESTLCCRGNPHQNTCQGDSGGPLVSIQDGRTTHVGIVSFVHAAGCSIALPSGFIRTASYLNWIRNNTGIEL